MMLAALVGGVIVFGLTSFFVFDALRVSYRHRRVGEELQAVDRELAKDREQMEWRRGW